MRAIPILLLVVLVWASAGAYSAPAKVTLVANDMPVKDAVDSITKQSGAQVLLDGEIIGKFNASLTDVEPDRAVEMVATSLKLEWKRIDLVTATESKVTPEKLRAAVAALTALDVPGISITDPASGKASVFARGVEKDTASKMKLPEGQKWQTFYLISKPAPKEVAAKPEAKSVTQQEAADRTSKIMTMAPEERQQLFQNEFNIEMQLPQETRTAIWRDRISAFQSTMQDPVMRDQLREMFRQMRPQGGPQPGPQE